jgi:hypothetical protein
VDYFGIEESKWPQFFFRNDKSEILGFPALLVTPEFEKLQSEVDEKSFRVTMRWQFAHTISKRTHTWDDITFIEIGKVFV